MNKKQKQNLFLYGGIITICAFILLILSFLMPDKPSYVMVDSQGNVQNNDETDIDKDDNDSLVSIGVVVLDPGHGGYDEGASSEDREIVEKDFDLEMALKVKEVLEENNVQVILTRSDDNVSWPSDNAKDLQARLDIATNANADLMVSLHCNVSDVDVNNVTGSEVYANAEQEDSTNLAKAIVDELDGLEPELQSRGVKSGLFHLTLFNKVPTAIVEMAFLSNPKDVEYLTNADTQAKMVESIANGIINYLKTDE